MAAAAVGYLQAQVAALQVRQQAAAKDEARTLASIGEAQQRLQVRNSGAGRVVFCKRLSCSAGSAQHEQN
jgi:hypothetical protein